jgi:hypothetical protein
MAEKVELEVRIGPDGRLQVETRGLRGQECVGETKDLLPALGKVVRREKTREYYTAATRERGVVRGR